MPRALNLPCLLLAVALCCASGGCAVMTVDIDAYTGPLSNHVDVQREQASVTALAAKPLLLKLRYQLELASRYQFSMLLGRNQLAGDPAAIERLKLSDTYIPALTAVTNGPVASKDPNDDATISARDGDAARATPPEFSFVSSQAAFVNRILAEYNNEPEAKATQQLLSDVAQLKEDEGARGSTKQDTLNKIDVRLKQAEQEAVQNTVMYHRQNAARARPGSGLEALTTFYLIRKNLDDAAQPGGRIPGHKYSREEGELFDALIHFAQKTLFSANNYVLFNEKYGVPQAIQGEVDSALHGGIGPFAVRDSYVTVLQTVGNSILVNLDELREREDHDQALKDARLREASAVEATATRSSAATLSDLLEAARATRDDFARHLPPTDKSPEDAIADAKNASTAADTAVTTAQTALKQASDDVVTKTTALQQATDALAKETDPTKQPPLKQQVDQATAALKTATTQAEAANKTATAAKADAAKATQLLKDRQAQAKAINLAIALDTAIANISTDGATNGSVILDRLKSELTKESADEKAKTPVVQSKVDALNDAIAVVKGTPAPMPLIPQVASATDAKGVIDAVIAVLRHEQIQAVREGGADSPVATKVAQALDVAYAQRAGMAYIRPASSYLRTSTPATSLQRDARIGYHNMLAEHMVHQLPLADLFANGGDYRTILQLDKQYWHNINTVRVAGGGNTNYVVAKDDIGNWYVKNYSADPKDIIKSAQGLGLFALGPALGSSELALKALNQDVAAKAAAGDVDAAKDAASQAAGIKKAADAATGAAAGGDTTSGTGTTATAPAKTAAPTTDLHDVGVLQREVSDAQSAFETKNKAQLATVQADAQGLQGSITTAWEADDTVKSYVPQLTPVLVEAAKDLAIKTPDAAKPTTSSEQILTTLEAMRQFHNDLELKLRDAKLTPPAGTPASDDVVSKALAPVRKLVREAMLKTLTPHEKAVQEYQVALDVVTRAQAAQP